MLSRAFQSGLEDVREGLMKTSNFLLETVSTNLICHATSEDMLVHNIEKWTGHFTIIDLFVSRVKHLFSLCVPLQSFFAQKSSRNSTKYALLERKKSLTPVNLKFFTSVKFIHARNRFCKFVHTCYGQTREFGKATRLQQKRRHNNKETLSSSNSHWTFFPPMQYPKLTSYWPSRKVMRRKNWVEVKFPSID